MAEDTTNKPKRLTMKSYAAKPEDAKTFYDWLLKMHPTANPKKENVVNRILTTNLHQRFTKFPNHGGIVVFSFDFSQVRMKQRCSPVVPKRKKSLSQSNLDCTGISVLNAADCTKGLMSGMFAEGVPGPKQIERFLKNIFLGNAYQANVVTDTSEAVQTFQRNSPGLISPSEFEFVSKQYNSEDLGPDSGYGKLAEIGTDMMKVSCSMEADTLGAVITRSPHTYCLAYNKPTGHFAVFDSHPQDLMSNGASIVMLGGVEYVEKWLLGDRGTIMTGADFLCEVTFVALSNGCPAAIKTVQKAIIITPLPDSDADPKTKTETTEEQKTDEPNPKEEHEETAEEVPAVPDEPKPKRKPEQKE